MMKGTIKFFHPEETLIYHVKKCFCKVVFQNTKNLFVLEIISTDELHHVEEDSIQNEFPEIYLNIEDFVISQNSIEELDNQIISIPFSYEEKTNQDGDTEEYYYTNLNVNDEVDVELNKNKLQFSIDANQELHLKWKGVADDFTDSNLDGIPFEVSCSFGDNIEEIED